MKITILDSYVINPGDLSFDALEELGDVTVYERTAPDDILSRIGDSYAIFTNKCLITAEIMDKCPELKFIGLLATGYDNVDVSAAKERGIAVCNVPAYSAESVAQHTFALLLELTNHVALHSASVFDGGWCRCPDYSMVIEPMFQLSGKTMGIIGYGSIGKRVGQIAEAFGMKVFAYSREPEKALAADVISVHCPATSENRGFIDREFLAGLKDGAYLVNTARGSLINEEALAEALRSGKLAGAAVDVVSEEPMSHDNPLLDAPNLFITAHMAFTSREARERVCSTIAANLKSFLEGGALNRL